MKSTCKLSLYRRSLLLLFLVTSVPLKLLAYVIAFIVASPFAAIWSVLQLSGVLAEAIGQKIKGFVHAVAWVTGWHGSWVCRPCKGCQSEFDDCEYKEPCFRYWRKGE